MKTRFIKLLLSLLLLTTTFLKAQEASHDTLVSIVGRISSDLDHLKRIKFSGYIMPQFQVADSTGQKSFSGGDFAAGVDKRFQLREARLKAIYETAFSQFVFQIDVSEKGVAIKDMYARITDPWTQWFQLKAGMFDRPFGFEIGYSTSQREAPDRGRMSQIIFPAERDLGAELVIQAPKGSNWNWLRVEGGMFNGTGASGVSGSANGNTSDFDSKKDFIGRISVTRNTVNEKIKYAVGASYYDGGYRTDNDTAWHIGSDSLGGEGFIMDDYLKQKGTINKRQYLGADFQVSIDWFPGITTLRAEYIQGKQPGTSSSTASPAFQPGLDGKTAASSTNPAAPIFKREFNGAYFYFIQNIGSTPLQAIVKYDWYDPNTDAKGDEIGKSLTGGKKYSATDIRYDDLGFGLAYRWDSNVKFTAYYDMVKNETSSNLSGYTKDLKDNLFTLRVQFKF